MIEEYKGMKEHAYEAKLDMIKLLAKEDGVELKVTSNEEAHEELKELGLHVFFKESNGGVIGMLVNLDEMEVVSAGRIEIDITDEDDGIGVSYSLGIYNDEVVKELNKESVKHD